MTLEEMFCDLYDKYGKDFNMVRILTGICFPSHRRTEHLSLN